jgi:hypothetical protein
MNVGVHKGTDFSGQTTRVSHGTYQIYTGSTGSGSTITKHYKSKSFTDTRLVDHYSDKRQCVRCGHRWAIAREEAGEAVRKYH